ncbi:Mediator of RNA polymerase II transcription subunit 6 [Balamuthia mandrillaris]
MAQKEEDQTGISFKDSAWLKAFPLNSQTVLDYFSLSSFYDRTCNNEQCKMQGRDLSFLTRMVGPEYALFYAAEAEGLFVIRKQIRESPETVTPIHTYYIVQGTIYQAPSLHAVISSRMISCMYYLHQSFQELHSYIEFDPSERPATMYNYNFSKQKKRSTAETAAKGEKTKDKRRRKEEEGSEEDEGEEEEGAGDDEEGEDEGESDEEDETDGEEENEEAKRIEASGQEQSLHARTAEELYEEQQKIKRSERILKSVFAKFPIPPIAQQPVPGVKPPGEANINGQP